MSRKNETRKFPAANENHASVKHILRTMDYTYSFEKSRIPTAI